MPDPPAILVGDDSPDGVVAPPVRRRPFISVVIPARNEEATIERAIAPLLAERVDADVEVIVADGRSTDRTRQLVEALALGDPRVRLVDNPARITPEGLNAAIRASRGDVIMRMDGHAVADPGYLAACLEVLRTSGAWDVGGRMRKIGVTRAGRAASAATTSAFGIGGGRRFHLLEVASDLDSVWLGCWPRWVFERVGLFDPELAQDQDEEMNQRIIDAGGRVRFDPRISSRYLSRGSWFGLLRQYFLYGRLKVRVIQMRPSIVRPRHLMPAALVAVLALGLFGGIVTPWAALIAVGTFFAWLATALWYGRSVAREFGATLPDVVVAYACLHLGYGLGMWVGIVRFAPRWIRSRGGSAPILEPRPADAPGRAG